ncbi:thioredoxin reductase [Tsukamurella pulmonis]|nr:thioredoxin reductase [Tsukamurella pulmonis]
MAEKNDPRDRDRQDGGRHVEVVIVGGGAAGLSAAVTLARALRSVIVLDGGEPRNAPAAAVHGLLGVEGINPLELVARGRAEASRYGAHVMHAAVSAARSLRDGGFTVDLDDGTSVRADQLLLATGVQDDLPAISGLAQRWGRDVVHCPYCHGWEIRGTRIALLATGPVSAMQAMLFGQWTEEMCFFPNGMDFPDAQIEQLTALGIDIDPGRVEEVVVGEDRLVAVRLSGGGERPLEALAVPTLPRARLTGLDGLGVTVESNPMGVALVVDEAGYTSVPGVWAAGTVTNPAMQLSEAAAHGSRVARTINTELVFRRAEAAVAGSRTPDPV